MDTRKELESLAGDKDALSNATATARIVADMMQQHERENKRLWMVIIVQALVSIVIAACMVWAMKNVQNVANEAVKEALATVAEIGVVEETTTTTTTTTQSVDGDNATINNGEWGQYNDTASKTEYQTGDQDGPEGE